MKEEMIDLFNEQRGEAELYLKADLNDEVPLPLTSEGFEGLLVAVCAKHQPGNPLPPPNDGLRLILAGFLHHIDNSENTITLAKIGKTLHKSVANMTSWRIDQTIKAKNRQEAAEAQQKAKEKADKERLENAENRRTKRALKAITK